MVTHFREELIDDLDGSPAVRSVYFTYQGTVFEIDLSEAHSQEFDAAMSPWVAAARRTATPGLPKPRRTAYGRRRSAAIRVWASEEQLVRVPYGRLPGRVVALYDNLPAEERAQRERNVKL
jgi:hypothetical protein